MKKYFLSKKSVNYLILVTYLSMLLGSNSLAENDTVSKFNYVHYEYSGVFINESTMTIVEGEHEIDKRDKIIQDFNVTKADYRIIHRFYMWWHATCQHVGHDEWIAYKQYRDGSVEKYGTLISYHQESLEKYNEISQNDRHVWKDWVEKERKNPTLEEEGYIKYERYCQYHKGWWATLGGHKEEKTVILDKLSDEPLITPQEVHPEGVIKFSPSSSEWTNKPFDVEVSVQGETSILKTGVRRRGYSYTTPATPTPDPENEASDTEPYEQTHYSSEPWEYYERWNIGRLAITGSPMGNKESAEISNNGKVTVTKEGIGVLGARLKGWTSSGSYWKSGSPPDGSWDGDSPGFTLSPVNLYNSTSGQYRLDMTKPEEMEVLWDKSGGKHTSKGYEIMCDANNTIRIKVEDNLSGIEKVKYYWSQGSERINHSSMREIPGSGTTEGMSSSKELVINVHDSTEYWALKKGTWYLHVYQIDRASNETYSKPVKVYVNKMGNLRINTIYDYEWKQYFVNEVNKPTNLSQNGIKVKDMPVFNNKEWKGIKLGYGIDFKIDTIGFEEGNDKITIDATFYVLDRGNNLYKADVYIPDSTGSYVRLDQRNPDYYTKCKSITLDVGARKKFEGSTTDTGYNTWSFNYYIPYTAKATIQGQPLNLEKDTNNFTNLLVMFEITGRKSDSRTFDFIRKENSWATSDGSLYGKSMPTGADLLSKGKGRGEVFWYNLTNTALDDIKMNRKW